MNEQPPVNPAAAPTPQAAPVAPKPAPPPPAKNLINVAPKDENLVGITAGIVAIFAPFTFVLAWTSIIAFIIAAIILVGVLVGFTYLMIKRNRAGE